MYKLLVINLLSVLLFSWIFKWFVEFTYFVGLWAGGMPSTVLSRDQYVFMGVNFASIVLITLLSSIVYLYMPKVSNIVTQVLDTVTRSIALVLTSIFVTFLILYLYLALSH